MKAYQLEEVKFAISPRDSGINIGLVWKEGGLYLAMSGIMISDGNVWYEIPIEKIRDITITEDEPPRLRINIPALDIEVSGERAETLMALRHFLLPQLVAKGGEEELINLVKLWGAGLHSPLLISSLMKTDERKIYHLIEKAEGEGYISGENITDRGISILSEEDREFIRKLRGEL